MPRLKRVSKRRDLSAGERCELQHGYSYFDGEEGFTDEEARCAAWRDHGERLLAAWVAEPGCAGRRPWAWWRYEAPESRNPAEHETAQLYRLGLLEGIERARLEQQWRRSVGFAREVAEHAVSPVTSVEAYRTYCRSQGVPEGWSVDLMAPEEEPDPDQDAPPVGRAD